MSNDPLARLAKLGARDRGAAGKDELPMIGLGLIPPPTAITRPATRQRTRLPWLLAALGFAAIAADVLGVALSAGNWTRGAAWDVNDVILLVAAWTGTVLGEAVGLWWWWRAPANPTGRLLYVAGLSEGVYLIGRCWPRSAWANELEWSTVLTVPLLALVVLGWPTGRPDRRVRLAALASCVGVAIADLIGDMFSRSVTPVPNWPDPPHALFTVPSVYHLVDPVQALLFQAFPAAIVIIVLVRRRQAMPSGLRPLITPVTAAGIVAAASLIVVHVGYQLFPDLLGFYDGFSTRALLVVVGDYLLVGYVAVGVLLGASRRRRAAESGTRRIVVELSSATPVVSPSAAAAVIVGDPTAVVRYVRPDGTWIDSAGAPIGAADSGRVYVPVTDGGGQLTAVLDLRSTTSLPPLLADLAGSSIAARADNERVTALAQARRAEVRARSRELVAAHDAGRRELERNLHDGAQQLLIGLSLATGLAARVGDTGASAAVIAHIDQVHNDILELLDAALPAVLTGGLSGALRSLSATCPVPVSYDADGDLAAEDPLAKTLYLVAGEAVTNAVKHARATTIAMTLTVSAHTAELRVHDDGIGGMTRVPPSIAGRVAGLGDAQLEQRARGSAVLVRLARRSAALTGRQS